MKFDDDYKPGFWSGTLLHERLEREGKSELTTPPITNVTREAFNDQKDPDWCIHFGIDEPSLRLRKSMYSIGAAIRNEFGNDAKDWAGGQLVMSAEPIEWVDRETKEHKSGYTMRIRPVPSNAYTTAKNGGKPAQASGTQLPAPAPSSKRELDDEVPW